MLHKQLSILNASSGLEGGLVWIGGKKAGWSDPWKYHETDIVYSNWNDGAYDVSMLQGICLNTTLRLITWNATFYNYRLLTVC